MDNISKLSIKILEISSSSSISSSFLTKFRIFKVLRIFTAFDEKRGFTVYQKILLSVTENISNFANWFFFVFSQEIAIKTLLFFVFFARIFSFIAEKRIKKSRTIYYRLMQVFRHRSSLIRAKVFFHQRSMFA